MKIFGNTINYLSCNITVSQHSLHGVILKPRTFIFPLITFGLASCYSPPNLAPGAAPDGDYILDPAHTSIIWSVSHVGLSNYTGRFDAVSGALQFDRDNPENSHVGIVVDPASVNTGDAEFDQEIAKKGSYFNAGDFPQIRFVSTGIIKTGENTGDLTGDLSFRGVTLPVTLNVVFNGAGKSIGHKGKTLGFSAQGNLLRSDFGLGHLISFGIGDEVTLVIETEFNEK
jgi:polyisoprenoid-binding protein YceI